MHNLVPRCTSRRHRDETTIPINYFVNAALIVLLVVTGCVPRSSRGVQCSVFHSVWDQAWKLEWACESLYWISTQSKSGSVTPGIDFAWQLTIINSVPLTHIHNRPSTSVHKLSLDSQFGQMNRLIN